MCTTTSSTTTTTVQKVRYIDLACLIQLFKATQRLNLRHSGFFFCSELTCAKKTKTIV
jgi:hypothetical protein